MVLDASLEARQVGVSVTYEDDRQGAFRNLPQRLFVIAQGETGMSFPTTKFLATSANQVGQIAGYRSAAYQMVRQLLPANGDGVGAVPVTVCLLEDDDDAETAVGDITPSGTATEAGQYRVNISEWKSQWFTIPKGAVNVSDTVRRVVEAVNDSLGAPGTLSYVYGTPSSSPGGTNVGNGALGTVTINGQPRPGAWTLLCTAVGVNAGTFSLTDPEGNVVTPSVTAGVAYDANGLAFTLADGATDFALNDTFTITVAATKADFAAGWAGLTGNDLDLLIEGPSVGVEWAYTQPAGGLVDPDPAPALAQVGTSWETMVLNGLHISNTTALDTYQEWGIGRWAPEVKKLVLVFTGAAITDVASATAVPDARKTDYINVQLGVPGSRNLPCVQAARELARIIRRANSTPSRDYCLMRADGLVPGADSVQWDLNARNLAMKGGASTVEIIDGVVRLSNTVTMYHPTGEDPPSLRHVVQIVKLQNVVYNADLIFSGEDWAGAALVPDDEVVTEPTAKKPKMAVADLAALVDNLAKAAILVDAANSKKTIRANINSANGNRLDVTGHVKISGNAHVIDVPISWAFFFGATSAAA